MSDPLPIEPHTSDGLSGPGSDQEREAVLEELVNRSAGLVGQAYLQRVVQDLARVLGVRYLFIGETVDGGLRARSLALAVDGELAENFEYDLAGTPCLQVTGGEACFIEDSAAELYPDDILLQDMGVESYFGFPLCDARGEPLGLVVALHDRPLPTSGWMRTLFRLISARGGAELARMRAEEKRLRSVEASRRFLEALNRLGVDPALQDGDVETMARRVAPAVREVAGFRDVSVWLRDTGEIPETVHGEGAEGLLEAPIVVGGEVRGRVTALPAGSVRDVAPETRKFLSDAAELLARTELERRRRAQERALAAARRLEALGSLAGGIAHDFNNVLGAILGNAELLLTEASGEQEDLAREVLDSARHGRELVRQIFEFAEGEAVNPEPVDPAELVDRTVKQVSPLAGDVRVRGSAEEGLESVHVDPVKLMQVLVNLCTNAVQALGGSGTVEVIARRATAGDRSAHPDLLSTPCLVLEVRDDGPGIPQELEDTLFEPFVTGRKGEGGTGLGLAIVDRVVRSHGGAVSVSSETGAGTTFTVLLPAGP